MAAPSPLQRSVTSISGSGAHNVTLFATLNSGDLVVALYTSGNQVTVATPSGWTEVEPELAGQATTTGAWVLESNGTEGGSSVDFNTGAGSVVGIVALYRFADGDWSGDVADIEATLAVGATGSINPPSHTPSQGSDDYWWAAWGLTRTQNTVTAAPTNYTNLQVGGVLGGTSNFAAAAERQLTASSEDPGTFTHAGSNQWGAGTLSVPPGAATGVTVDTAAAVVSTRAAATTVDVAALAVDTDGSHIRLRAAVSDVVAAQTDIDTEAARVGTRAAVTDIDAGATTVDTDAARIHTRAGASSVELGATTVDTTAARLSVRAATTTIELGAASVDTQAARLAVRAATTTVESGGEFIDTDAARVRLRSSDTSLVLGPVTVETLGGRVSVRSAVTSVEIGALPVDIDTSAARIWTRAGITSVLVGGQFVPVVTCGMDHLGVACGSASLGVECGLDSLTVRCS